MSQEEKNIQGQKFSDEDGFHARDFNSIDFKYDDEDRFPVDAAGTDDVLGVVTGPDPESCAAPGACHFSRP